MSRTPRPLVEVPGRIEVLVGPAASTPPAAVVRAYCEGATHDLAGKLWIAPDAMRLAAVHDALLAAGPIWLSPSVKTLAQFAESLISADLASRRQLPRSETRRLLAKAIETLHSGGQLPVLGPVAERGGLIDAVDAAVADAKSHAIDAETFAAWAAGRGRGAKDREIATIYRTYQSMLDAEQSADTGDRYRAAQASLERFANRRWQLVVIDDFDRLAHDQWQFLCAVLARSVRGLISVVGEADSGRAEVFADPLALVARVKQTFASATVHHAEPCVVPPQSLVAASERLFAATPQAMPTAGVDILKARSPHDEWQQVARLVKQWIADEECAADDIVVAAATLPAARQRATSLLAEFGVPAVVEPAPPAIESGELRTLIDLLELTRDDWPFDHVLRVVGNRLLRQFDAPAAEASGLASGRACAEWSIRDVQLSHGESLLLSELDRRCQLATPADEPGDELQRVEPSARHWRAAGAMLLLGPMAESLARLPQQASPVGWCDALVRLAGELQLDLPVSCEGGWPIVRDALHWAALADTHALWQLDELIEFVRDVATTSRLETASDRGGRVRVLPLARAARASCRRLVLVGMDESALSARESAASIYSPGDWHRISGTAADVVPRYAQQMLLFYRLASLPSERLVATYPALDSKGQGVPACPYLHDLDAATGGALAATLASEPTIAVVHRGPPASERDLRRLAVEGAMHRDVSLLGAVQSLAVGRHLLDSLQVVLSRSRGTEHGPFEGMVTSPAVRDKLAASFDSSRQWSVSQLEAYAECPFKFAAKYIVHAESPGDLSLSTNHARRGQLAHLALWELHRQLRATGHRSPAELPLDKFIELYTAAVTTMRQSLPESGSEAALVEIEASQVVRWGYQFHRHSSDYVATHAEQGMHQVPAAQHLEWRFGKPSRDSVDEKEDPGSTDEPFVLRVEGEEIRFGGRIDRIDVGRVGDVRVFNIVDYKSSKSARVDIEAVELGEQLQLPLYAWAVANLLLGGPDPAFPLAAGYWELRGKGFHDKSTLAMHRVEAAQVVAIDDWTKSQQKVRGRVAAMIAAIRRGDFPMQNRDEKCTTFCDFAQVCRVAQVRALGKATPLAVPAAGTSEGDNSP
jgi:hypothetical protein